MKDSIKYEISRHMRHMYKVKLTQAQLDDIHDFYHVERKQSIMNLAIFRYINMMLSVVSLITFFIVGCTIRGNIFVFVVLNLFMIYNLIHGLINYVQYKKIKDPKRPSDEG
jgi:hypothetical protein